jgi:hypothetical protein
MKSKTWDHATGCGMAALGGALSATTDYTVTGFVVMGFAFLWTTGYITEGMKTQENEERVEETPKRSTFRQRLQQRGVKA